MVVSGITSFMIDMYADNILNLSQNYMIMPDAIHYLKAHKSIMAILKTVNEEEITCREFFGTGKNTSISCSVHLL
ncbi:MAG: hypothetical protein ACLU8S_14720 [Coprococcus phoceensis]